ncbi:MBL fold metallo-hydrolase [Amycolatopsis sp. NPDC051061]|uniref:MBL fold metallo-hydrolase n=1 Tax=Amycolatopsis sp. NPDC051061 TaxID=3155042 RepID=UPI0034488D33
MLFTQYYLDCLSQASYLVADETTGDAVIVDPRRDVAEYTSDLRSHRLTLKGVINTHFHADFVAGHLELAALTGAWIGYGRSAETGYPIRRLRDGERISLGDVTLQILETPGHTTESISVLVHEHADDDVPFGVLTGDALFIGDVGRPDLLASAGVTAEQLARMLYDSVQHKLMALPDTVRVFPAHGAGSACGKNLSTERSSTIGAQRIENYACVPMSEDDFVAAVTEGQSATPAYFAYDAQFNKQEHDLFSAVASRPLTAPEVLRLRDSGAILLDARAPQEFASGHLRGSLNVPVDGRFAEWAGTVTPPENDLVLIAPDGRQDELVIRLARVGFDRVAGHLDDPDTAMTAIAPEVDRASRITADHLRRSLAAVSPPAVIDVRGDDERVAGAIEGSLHIPLAELPSRVGEIPHDHPIVLHCAGGHRSSIAASVLRRAGHTDVSDLLGGYAAWLPHGEKPKTGKPAL